MGVGGYIIQKWQHSDLSHQLVQAAEVSRNVVSRKNQCVVRKNYNSAGAVTYFKVTARLVDTISTVAAKANSLYDRRGGAESSRICSIFGEVQIKV